MNSSWPVVDPSASGMTRSLGHPVTIASTSILNSLRPEWLGQNNASLALAFTSCDPFTMTHTGVLHVENEGAHWFPIDYNVLKLPQEEFGAGLCGPVQYLSWEFVSVGNVIQPSGTSIQLAYSGQTISWKDLLIQEIDAYADREAGWDGYEAIRISPKSIRDTQEFIAALPEGLTPPRDQPCSDGEVSLVWRERERFAEIGFPGDGTFYWFATDGDRKDRDDDIPIRRGLPLHLQEIAGIRPKKGIASSIPPMDYTLLLAVA